MVGVAQLVEHWVVAPVVAGSSPVTHPIKYVIKLGSYQLPFFMSMPIFQGMVNVLINVFH